MFDLTIEFGDRPDGLAIMGEALGAAGISVEGGALFTVDGKATGVSPSPPREPGQNEDMAFTLTEQIERHLLQDQIAWLTTVSPTGWPAPNAVWFVWDGREVTVYSQNNGAKLRHIEASDKVALSFDSGPGGGDIVVISGRARLVPDCPPPSEFPGLLDKYQPALDAMGRTAQWYDDYGQAIRITPERARAIP